MQGRKVKRSPVIERSIVDIDWVGVELFIEKLVEKVMIFLADAHEELLMNFIRLIPVIVPNIV